MVINTKTCRRTNLLLRRGGSSLLKYHVGMHYGRLLRCYAHLCAYICLICHRCISFGKREYKIVLKKRERKRKMNYRTSRRNCQFPSALREFGLSGSTAKRFHTHHSLTKTPCKLPVMGGEWRR